MKRLGIGSVLTPPSRDAAPGEDLWSLWTNAFPHVVTYASARSALAALFADRGVKRVWLPAYLCRAAAEAAEGLEIAWYETDLRLQVEISSLAGLKPGDAVVGVDYFGRSPSDEFIDLKKRRPDVLWIEDRAQAAAPDKPPWGDVLIYSPRKLVGVGDGGLMVSNTALPPPKDLEAPPPRAEAQVLRRDRPEEADEWFRAFQRQEADFHVDRRPMTEGSIEQLKGAAAAPLIRRRQNNFGALAAMLHDVALWPGQTGTFAPLAFPIMTPDAADTARVMAAEGVWCARHWADLPSHDAAAKTLSGRLLSLPCDQRYDAGDMRRVAAALRRALQAGAR